MGSSVYIEVASICFSILFQDGENGGACMCRDDDGGCRRRTGVALAGVFFGLVEESTNVYFTILFWEISSRLL